jgi:hypothetical protein
MNPKKIKIKICSVSYNLPPFVVAYEQNMAKIHNICKIKCKLPKSHAMIFNVHRMQVFQFQVAKVYHNKNIKLE